jgi:TonB family protein
VKTRVVIAYGLIIGSLAAQSAKSSPETAVGVPTPSAPRPVASSGPSKIDPSKEADIRRLLDLMGTAKLARQVMDLTEENLKPLLSESLPPGEYREKLIDLFFAKLHSKFAAQQFIDIVVPSYDKYFTDEEIKGLIQFYESPLGQKMASVQPELASESQKAGKQWAVVWAQESMRDVLLEHPDLAAALKSAELTNKATAPSSMPPVGEVTGVNGGIAGQAPLNSSSSPAQQRVRVASGIESGLLVSKVAPVYPDVARQARVQGTVLLKAHISKDGNIMDLQLISGHPMLVPAAIEAVEQWKYKPYLLNGEPVEVETKVQVNFVLSP